MSLTRRELIGNIGKVAAVAGVTASLGPKALASLSAAAPSLQGLTPEQAAKEEDYWAVVQQAFTADRGLLNLNNGGVSPSPRAVQEALAHYFDLSNKAPTHYMWGTLEPKRETVRTQLARLCGSSPDEVAIVRNATEALETVTFGLELKPGDEVLSTNQDYGRMRTAWRQRALRDGIVFKTISLPTPPEDLSEIVEAFERAITPRTRVLHFCHMINLTGQLLPVQELCRLARQRGILSLVDGAHSFSHIDFKVADLGCDFFGTSLHKWLSAPFGTGMLYVRREHIESLWPLFADAEPRGGNIRKFEQIGTHPCPIFLSIAEAVDFNDRIGIARKEARLRYLRNYWADRLKDRPGVRFHTSFARNQSCALANVELEGIDSSELSEYLLNHHRIVVAPIKHKEFQGIRVTPHLYTTLPELDRFVDAMDQIRAEGLPA